MTDSTVHPNSCYGQEFMGKDFGHKLAYDLTRRKRFHILCNIQLCCEVVQQMVRSCIIRLNFHFSQWCSKLRCSSGIHGHYLQTLTTQKKEH